MKRKRASGRDVGERSWIEQLPPWEGPEGTLFLYSANEGIWYISAADGSEARVSARDLRSFVVKCLAARGSR